MVSLSVRAHQPVSFSRSWEKKLWFCLFALPPGGTWRRILVVLSMVQRVSDLMLEAYRSHCDNAHQPTSHPGRPPRPQLRCSSQWETASTSIPLLLAKTAMHMAALDGLCLLVLQRV